ncbi:MAG: hypothetical protein E6R03_10885 [Hyphomicrobiaceae bacterium]|nr:MAG: hypothetical protein E6R03_10885 [Hyphomicrobiaceae bacterium]
MQLIVKRIKNRGTHGEYPALKNIQTGKIYVDITLGEQRFLEADANGENRHGDFVAYNIPGAWHSFIGEPECPLRRDIEFVLVVDQSNEATSNPPGYAGPAPAGVDYSDWLAVNNID